MTSEWLKVMLEEIERKRIEEDQALREQQRREKEGGAEPASRPAPPTDRSEG